MHYLLTDGQLSFLAEMLAVRATAVFDNFGLRLAQKPWVHLVRDESGQEVLCFYAPVRRAY